MVEVNIVNNNKKNKDIGYIDVTEEWLANATPNSHKVKDRNYYETKDGIKYYVDNKNVVLEYSKEEKETAQWLANTLGGKIYMNPKVNKPKGIRTSDYLWNNERWDLKSLSEKAVSKNRAIDNVVKTAKNQTENIIIDITKTNIIINKIIKQVKQIYQTKGREWVNCIIIKKDNKLIKVYKR